MMLFFTCSQISLEAFVKSRNICWVWSGMPGHVQDSPNNKITKQQYLWEGLSYFVYLLHAVTRLQKLWCYNIVLFGYGPACLKFSEATNYQYLQKGSCDFVDFLQVVICILLDIKWKLSMLYMHGRYLCCLCMEDIYAILGWHCQAQPLSQSDCQMF